MKPLKPMRATQSASEVSAKSVLLYKLHCLVQVDTNVTELVSPFRHTLNAPFARRKTGKRRFEAQIHPPLTAEAENELDGPAGAGNSRMRMDGRVKDIYLGVYATAEEAAMTVDRALLKFFGVHAASKLNVRCATSSTVPPAC
jgi:hypothetical protein